VPLFQCRFVVSKAIPNTSFFHALGGEVGWRWEGGTERRRPLWVFQTALNQSLILQVCWSVTVNPNAPVSLAEKLTSDKI